MGSRHLTVTYRSKRYRRTDRQTNITVASSCYAKHRAVKTISPMLLFGREIIFEEFLPMWSWCLNVTDGQTTDDMQSHNCALRSTRGSLPDSHCLRYV